MALRHNPEELAADLWAQLAKQHDGKDRWYLEALGIGADGQWDKYFGAWRKITADPLANLGSRDIVWRSRTKESVPFLAKLASDKSAPLKERLRYFRAFDFNPGATEKSTALLGLMQASTDNEITKLCLRHLDPAFVKTAPVAQVSLQKLLNATYGTSEYMEMIARYEPITENKRLLDLAVNKATENLGRDAARQLLKQNGEALLWEAINGKETSKATAALASLRSVGNKQSLNILKTVALDAKRKAVLRREATRAIGGSWDGEEMAIDLLKTNQLTGDLKASAVQGVSGAWRKAIRSEAAKYLDAGGKATAAKKLPSLSELAAMTGNATNGQKVFAAQCAVCHQINGEGMDFGPKLSEIGSKYGKDGQYLAIFYPSAGVSFGYEGYEVKFKDGSTMQGIVASKTETDLTLKFPGGTSQNYKMNQVVSMKKLDESLMTAGLHDSMTQNELVDLVEYLASLKKK